MLRGVLIEAEGGCMICIFVQRIEDYMPCHAMT